MGFEATGDRQAVIADTDRELARRPIDSENRRESQLCEGRSSGGIASNTARSCGMTAQGGRLRAKMATFGWKDEGSSSESA